MTPFALTFLLAIVGNAPDTKHTILTRGLAEVQLSAGWERGRTRLVVNVGLMNTVLEEERFLPVTELQLKPNAPRKIEIGIEFKL